MWRVGAVVVWMALGCAIVETLPSSGWDSRVPAFAMPTAPVRVQSPGPRTLCGRWAAAPNCPTQGRRVSAVGLLRMMAKGGRGDRQQQRKRGEGRKETDGSKPDVDRFVPRLCPIFSRLLQTCSHAGRLQAVYFPVDAECCPAIDWPTAILDCCVTELRPRSQAVAHIRPFCWRLMLMGSMCSSEQNV